MLPVKLPVTLPVTLPPKLLPVAPGMPNAAPSRARADFAATRARADGRTPATLVSGRAGTGAGGGNASSRPQASSSIFASAFEREAGGNGPEPNWSSALILRAANFLRPPRGIAPAGFSAAGGEDFAAGAGDGDVTGNADRDGLRVRSEILLLGPGLSSDKGVAGWASGVAKPVLILESVSSVAKGGAPAEA